MNVKKVFKVENVKGVTNIDEISGIDKMSVIYELLGGSPSDLLLQETSLLLKEKAMNNFK